MIADLMLFPTVATAVTAKLPSVSAANVGTVREYSPLLSAVVEPSEEPLAKSSTDAPASAVPVNVGVELLVRLSVEELPVSEASIRSGVDGAGVICVVIGMVNSVVRNVSGQRRLLVVVLRQVFMSGFFRCR